MASRSFIGSWPPSNHSVQSDIQVLPNAIYERYRSPSRGRAPPADFIRSARGKDKRFAGSIHTVPELIDDRHIESDTDSVTIAKSSVRSFISPKSEISRRSIISQKSETYKRTTTGLRWIALLGAVYSTMFLFALDNTIVANIQPAIIQDFGEVEKLAWIAVAFTLTAAGSVLLWGSIFSNFDCKWAYITTVAIFEGGSAICGAAPNMNILIAGRAIAGFGAQGLYLGAMTFVGALTTPEERSLYVAFSGAVWGLGTVLGPVVGGLFTDSSATWRWSFYINLCIGGVFAPIYLFILPSITLQESGSLWQRWKKIDYLGAFLLPGAMTMLISGIVLGGESAPWKSAKVICLIILSLVVFALFCFQQHWTIFTTRATRMWPSGIKINLEIIVLCIQCCNAGVIAFVTIFFLPLYYQFTRGISPVDTAKEISPLVVFLVFGALLSGGLVTKFKRYFVWFFVAALCAVPGGALMYITKVDTSNAQTYGAQVLIGIGSGTVMQLPFSILQIKADPKNVALVTGIISVAQIGALALFLAVANAVFLNVASNTLAAALPQLGRHEIESLLSGASGDILLSLSPEQQILTLEKIVAAMGDTYIIVIAAACINLLTSFLIMNQGVEFHADLISTDKNGADTATLKSVVAKARRIMDLEASNGPTKQSSTTAVAVEKEKHIPSSKAVSPPKHRSPQNRSPHARSPHSGAKKSTTQHARPTTVDRKKTTHPARRDVERPTATRAPRKQPHRRAALEISCTVIKNDNDD